ncbi:MAG: DUF5658 family protein [Woeseiaceae bacterium]|nr:DUF5658 family protein [Woeseiaceae bacterium]
MDTENSAETSGTTTIRTIAERRQFTWRTVFYGFTLSRRRDHRREEDGEPIFIDWHHPWLFIMSVGTMILSAADAFLTLQLIEKGMIEANPFMAKAMEYGTGVFAASKMTMTAAGILTLVFLAKAHVFNRFRTGLFMTIFFSSYLCLICYELVNLMELT